MSETELTYQDLIKEAFIDPIRTVTVIDDEYPTFKELLDGFDNERFSSRENVERLKKISEMCHNTYKWSLDVFNGKSPRIGDDNYIPEHLNHSDLLILDYHLDGEPTSDNGERARNIIKKLDSNNHFNIILVHTKGVDEDIKNVYEEILFDLHKVKLPNFLIIDDNTVSLIEDWLDNHNDGEGYSWLDNSLKFGKTKLLKLLECKNHKLSLNVRNPQHIFYPYEEQIRDIAKDSGVSIQNLIKWRLSEICKEQQISFSSASRGDLIWDLPEGEANFIATGRVFVSVIRKVSDDPEAELYQALCNSLKNYDASPMHLLMAKIRHEIDERGFEQAQSIIANRQAQAGWLFTVLSSSSDNFVHDKAIDLHWEQLGRASKSSLRAFSQKISDVLSGQQEPKEVVKRFFRECIGNSDESCGQLNAFTCSMPVVGSHLNTGSILEIDNEYWVCLTPSCDLVPGQKSSSWENRIGARYLPFKAVLLHEANLSTANGKANTNEYVYLNLGGQTGLKAFSFAEGGSPIWDTFYASNQGRFAEGNMIGLAQVREISSENNSEEHLQNGETEATESEISLSIKNVQAKVVAELRYEYALNLLQRLGANQTRVGLDFIDKKSLWR